MIALHIGLPLPTGSVAPPDALMFPPEKLDAVNPVYINVVQTFQSCPVCLCPHFHLTILTKRFRDTLLSNTACPRFPSVFVVLLNRARALYGSRIFRKSLFPGELTDNDAELAC